MTATSARPFIEAAREHARISRDTMIESGKDLAPVLRQMLTAREAQEARMNMVMDSYLTGVEETIKRLHGDESPEPWTEEYDHETRIQELLEKYSL